MTSSEANEISNAEQSTFLTKKENMDLGDMKETKVDIENRVKKGHIYGVNDSPPLSVTIICGLQVRTGLFYFFFFFFSLHEQKHVISMI